MKKYQKTILIITDGIGHNENEFYNAFFHAKKPNYDYLFKNVPYSLIKTSSFAVGLPKGQMGNSEVGHMCIGSGRVLHQSLVKIDNAIKSGELKQNKTLQSFISKFDKIHIIGLASDGGVHSHINHFKELAKICSSKNVSLHLITDGRDVSPTSGLGFVKDMQDIQNSNIKIATICGRYFTMDRDKRFDRVQKGYDEMCLATNKTKLSPDEYIRKSYEENITDEFIKPASFNEFDGIKENDGLLFINFRNDRMKEIVSAFGSSEFDEFKREFVIKNILTMTNYDDTFEYEILFHSQKPENTLPQVISKAGLSQLHTAETEKYAHVTFFFNGGKDEPEENETRVLIPSPKVATYDLMPQMSAYEVCDVVLEGMEFGYEFIVVNFANGDMVGHTGDFEASIKAIEVVDENIGRVLQKAKQKDYSLVLTSDHGNCEALKDEQGKILTNHTTFDVYCFVMDKNVKNVKSGALSNIAPTILKIMGLEIPDEMDSTLI